MDICGGRAVTGCPAPGELKHRGEGGAVKEQGGPASGGGIGIQLCSCVVSSDETITGFLLHMGITPLAKPPAPVGSAAPDPSQPLMAVHSAKVFSGLCKP